MKHYCLPCNHQINYIVVFKSCMYSNLNTNTHTITCIQPKQFIQSFSKGCGGVKNLLYMCACEGGRSNTTIAINECHCGQAYDNLIDRNGRESSLAVVDPEHINVLIQPHTI